MRLLAAVFFVAMVCMCTAAVTGAKPPPTGPGGIHVVKLKPLKQAKSCAAHPHSRTAAGKITRKLTPVACEQPPKANVVDLGVVLFLRP
jgi:hypothetical protein